MSHGPVSLVQARLEAAALAGDEPPEWGYFLWLQKLLGEHGDPVLPWWWQGALLEFIRSGKMVWYVAAGLRAIKSNATTIPLLANVLLRPRKAIMGQAFVCPIIAAGKPEAGGRVLTIRYLLRDVLGWRERERKGKGESDIVDAGEYLYSYTPHTGDGIFILRDVSDNLITIQTKVASLAGVREYTGIEGMIDEADHIPLIAEGGGAHEILDYAIARMTGQPGARIYCVSNPTHERALLSAACLAGDGSNSHIARLGIEGARHDNEERARLAAHLRAIGEHELAADERLHEAADPNGWRIPSWVGRPNGSDIMQCWDLSCDSAARKGELDKLGTLFRIYGARSKGAEGASHIDRLALQRCLVPAPLVPSYVKAFHDMVIE